VKVSALDLNAAQTAAVEEAVGIPIQRWGVDPDVSVADIFRHLLVQVGGVTFDQAAAMTNREVFARCTLAPDDPKAQLSSKRGT
jgi:hypothetical protein